MSKGYVYILKNPSMPGLLKIGKTTRSVEQRCNELWQTGVPTPFSVVDEVYSPDCGALEREVHEYLDYGRVTAAREFFAVEEFQATDMLRTCLLDQVQGLVEEFLPDHSLIEDDMVVSTADITLLATHLDCHAFEVASAMEFLTAEEVRPGLERWRERIAARKEARLNGEPMPEFKPANEDPF